MLELIVFPWHRLAVSWIDFKEVKPDGVGPQFDQSGDARQPTPGEFGELTKLPGGRRGEEVTVPGEAVVQIRGLDADMMEAFERGLLSMGSVRDPFQK